MSSISVIVTTSIYGIQSASVTCNINNRWDHPCGACDDKPPVYPRGINDMIDNITSGIDGVKNHARDLKEYVSLFRYHSCCCS